MVSPILEPLCGMSSMKIQNIIERVVEMLVKVPGNPIRENHPVEGGGWNGLMFL
jgi:hypothetical protein